MLTFPSTRIAPVEDPTERALSRIFEASDDFRDAITDARTVDRAIQLKARLRAANELLTDLENQALQKMEAL